MRQAFITFGIPGSGKSTYLNEIKDMFSKVDLVSDEMFVSADEIMKTLPGYDPKNSTPVYQEAVKIAEQRVYELADKDKELYFDTGSINSNYSKRIFGALKKRGYYITLIVFTTPLEECLKRNRERTVTIPDEVIIEKHSRAPKCLMELLPYCDVIYPCDGGYHVDLA